jgi:hypothetical protein
MKVLSIDVGIKNLAFCLFEKVDDQFKIIQWDTVNISEKEEILKCSFNEKNGVCNKPAKYNKYDACYCLKHSKKQTYMIPTNELKPSYINKQKIQQLQEIADKYNIFYEKQTKKSDMVSLVNKYIEDNCFEQIGSVNASKVDLINIGLNIKHKFDKLFDKEGTIDYVVIENQISPLANRMKTIQGMIAQYFIMTTSNIPKIEFVAASNKLKDCEASEKTNYKDRKKLGIKKCLELITTNNYLVDQIDYFDKHAKKDDLADSFLQGVWFINDRNLGKT